MSSKVKKSRKELLHEPDEFMVFSGRIVKFLRSYQQQALYAVVGIFLILGTAAVIRYVSDSNENKASRRWAEIKAQYQSALQEKAAGGTATAAAEAALAAVDADFTELIEKYGGKQTGKLARLNYAQLCLSAGKADAALPHFKAAFDAFGGDPAWREVALSGLAHALAQTGAYDLAAARFEEVVNGPGTVLKAEALFQLGWLYGKSGEGEKGQKAYQQLIDDFPDSSYAQLVRDRLAQSKMGG